MKLKSFAAAAALATAVSSAFAQDALIFVPNGSGLLETSFERTVTGVFLDTFTFSPESVSGTVSVSLSVIDGPVNFFSAILNGEGFSFLPELGETTFSFQSTVSADQPLELQVFGYAGDAATLTDMTASYGGNISVQGVSAIPEPATSGLLLAGLGLVALAARRPRATARDER